MGLALTVGSSRRGGLDLVKSSYSFFLHLFPLLFTLNHLACLVSGASLLGVIVNILQLLGNH